jgi:hypothetical protein
MKTLAGVVNGNPNLEVFRAVGNRCMQRDVSDDRVKLLSRIPRCALQGFSFVLNGVKVSIVERLDAVRRKAIPISVFTGLGDVRVVRGAGESEEKADHGPATLRGAVKKLEFDEENLSRLRLALEMEAANLKGNETVLVLPNRKLDYVADLVRGVFFPYDIVRAPDPDTLCWQAWCPRYCQHLEALDLSNNMLRTLTGQGLQYLGALRVLDLRGNTFNSLDEVVTELQKCSSLKELYLVVGCFLRAVFGPHVSQ